MSERCVRCASRLSAPAASSARAAEQDYNRLRCGPWTANNANASRLWGSVKCTDGRNWPSACTNRTPNCTLKRMPAMRANETAYSAVAANSARKMVTENENGHEEAHLVHHKSNIFANKARGGERERSVARGSQRECAGLG